MCRRFLGRFPLFINKKENVEKEKLKKFMIYV